MRRAGTATLQMMLVCYVESTRHQVMLKAKMPGELYIANSTDSLAIEHVDGGAHKGKTYYRDSFLQNSATN
jgi:hypothetical protein